jgi:GNAT superfamily N-acetyltransferase
MTTVYAKILTTPEQAQQIREVRNNARQYMTRHTEHITPQQQARWFTIYCTDPNQYMFLYYNEYYCLVGYGYVVLRNNQYWGSLVVKPEFQGAGIGTMIYQDMITNYHDVWIEIYADNAESLGAAVKSGFKQMYVTDNIVIMRGTDDTII